VFLAGLSDGLMPISLAETDEAVAEERRLLYVGITRARVHLDLSFARARNPGGRASRRRTRFLDGIWPNEPRAARPRSAARRSLAESLSGDDAELFEQLRSWRSTVATETDKPAFTVLVDATLVEIASTRPATIVELARVAGIGPAKLDRYGQTLLALVSAPR
jgi:DNA helicase-2/ATP-dependent DNA helicase PcrA